MGAKMKPPRHLQITFPLFLWQSSKQKEKEVFTLESPVVQTMCIRKRDDNLEKKQLLGWYVKGNQRGNPCHCRGPIPIPRNTQMRHVRKASQKSQKGIHVCIGNPMTSSLATENNLSITDSSKFPGITEVGTDAKP